MFFLFSLSCTNKDQVENSGVLGLLNAGSGTPEYFEFSNEAVNLNYKTYGDAKSSQDQKLIKESYLVFETGDIDKSYSNIVAVIKKYNGYIQDDSAEKDYYRIIRRLTVRIPTANFQNTIDDVSKNVEYFDTKQTTLRDVTEEFIDLEARLKAKKELEKRYLELLKKAKNVQELLEVEKELSHIREEIEAKQGRLKYLENKVSLSSINIEFYKTNSESKVTKSYGSKMWNAIVSGFDGLSTFFLGILYIWPFIIILIIVFFIIKRWLKKRKKNEANSKK
ncbi:DUF4349 domain-containing protein [Winogradskyella ouciana]|uniref:DUF4349 domain-containing protein n=1 Tax=Winogradskyella ouciana TaxID=2608631 RepID=UPI003D2B126F